MGYDMVIIIFTMVLVITVSLIYADVSCSRRDSRIAEEIIKERLVPIFDDTSHKMPDGCPLDPARSMYRDNEQHKLQEDPNRWSCQYCGKAFGNQGFLDDHFDRRHKSTILQPPSGVCLASYCDILRCEVNSPSYKPKPSCNNTLMTTLHNRCVKTVKGCVPLHLSGMKKYSFINDMRLPVCEYLTCERYDEPPIPRPSHFLRIAAILVGISFFFSAVIFSLLVCTDALMTEPLDENGVILRKKRSKHVVIRIPGGSGTLRQRHRDDTDDDEDHYS